MKGKYLKPKAMKKASGKTVLLISIIVLLVVIIAGLLFVVISMMNENKTAQPGLPEQKVESTEPVEKLTDSIALPGYAGLYLKAGVKEQNTALPNPPENFCQIRMSLVLEDGAVIWTSDLVLPGETAQIVLNEDLEAGEYSATLKYDCFKIDENMSTLNGGTCKLKLHVN